MKNSLVAIRQERIKKIKKLRNKNKDSYPSFCRKKTTIKQARKMMNKKVAVVGRVFTQRGHGKLVFADLKDETEKIQLMFKQDVLAKNYFSLIKLIDIGDFLFVKGTVTKTVKGEVSILVKEFTLLSKSIRPLPDKWHGLKDIEERYRQRYLDLLINPQVKKVFLIRTQVINLLRDYLNRHGFIEVETPILQPIYGGATAKPFITHHNALNCDFYLRIADELYLKKLIVGGFEKVYEIGKDFRNEGISKSHNPEFTQLEFYWAYTDYNFLMEFTEKMLSDIIKKIKGSLKIKYKNKTYDFSLPWERISYQDLFIKYLKIDINKIKTEKELIKIVKKGNLLNEKRVIGYGNILDKLYKKYIRPKLKGPLFIIDYPVELKPLAKRRKDNPSKAAVFQLLVAGEEFINAYNELNDPQDQESRWLKELELSKKGAEEFQVLDKDYIKALEYGMPPTAGWGMGIDRFTAFLTDQKNIKDVILFPTLRPEDNHHKPASNNLINNHHQTDKKIISRQKALEILTSQTKNKNLVKHGLAVEAAMKELASHFNQDPNLWGIAGLIHDADWEQTQNCHELHGKKTVQWLRQAGETNKQLLQAILSHNFERNKETPPQSSFEWSLYCCDELTGLIIATALVMPEKKLSKVSVESVLKKFPSKSFAKGVNREQIKLCQEKLNIPLKEFIGMILKSMEKISDQLGL